MRLQDGLHKAINLAVNMLPDHSNRGLNLTVVFFRNVEQIFSVHHWTLFLTNMTAERYPEPRQFWMAGAKKLRW